MAKLTPKQERFVDEYLVDLNATAAAKRAGYSEKSASRIAIELLNKTHVSAAIQARRDKLRGKLEITQEAVLQELASIAFANGTDFVTVTGAGLLCVKATSEVPKNKLPAIAGIKYSQLGIEIKLHDKVRALELLGKHLGVFATAAEENNIFEVIEQSTREEIDTNEIPEIEPPAEPGDDVVE
jgi:phage terminase small subunit